MKPGVPGTPGGRVAISRLRPTNSLTHSISQRILKTPSRIFLSGCRVLSLSSSELAQGLLFGLSRRSATRLGRSGVSRFFGEVSMKGKIHEIRAGLSGASLTRSEACQHDWQQVRDTQIVAEWRPVRSQPVPASCGINVNGSGADSEPRRSGDGSGHAA